MYGLSSSQLNDKLASLICFDKNPFLGIYYENEQVKIQITAKASSKTEASRLIDKVSQQIKAKLGDYIFDDHEADLAQTVKKILKKQGKKITAAESLTDGSFLNVISGETKASEIFEGGIFSYSEDIKNHRLANFKSQSVIL